MRFVVFVTMCGLVACKGGAPSGVVEKVEGTATIAGQAVELRSCKAVTASHGHGVLELGLGDQVVLVIDPFDGTKLRRGAEVRAAQCSRVAFDGGIGKSGERVWGEATIGFTCESADGEIVVDAKVDCGATQRVGNQVPRKKMDAPRDAGG